MKNINKKLPITNPIHQELLRVPCETHQLLVSHICTASECQKRFMCSKCLMNDAKHNKSHHPKFSDLANFFKNYENQKDSNMALVEDDMLELRLKKEKASKNIKILNEQKNILTYKLEEIAINFFNECEKKFLENFNLFKKDFQKNIAIFFETKVQSFKNYEENLENEIIKLDVTSNKIGFKEGMMRSSSLSNNKKDFKRSFSQENYLKQIIENMINAVQGHKISNDVFSKEIDSYMEKDFFNQIREDYEKNIFLNVKNELNNCIAKLRIINDDMGKEYVEKNFVELKTIENLIQLPSNLKIGELSLAFSMKKYTDDEAEKIMKFLNTASVTEKLNCNFYDNRFSDKGLSMISQGISKNSSIHTIELFLGDNPSITNDGLQKFFKSISDCVRMKAVNIGVSSNEKINDESLYYISDFISTSKYLQKFHLFCASTSITNTGMENLLKSIGKCQTLKSLKLAIYENKQLNDITGRALADNLILLSDLEELELYVYDTKITAMARDLIDQVAKSLLKLHTFNMVYLDL